MYHALLTNRYLTTRVIPFIAVGAVALCVALVIIVVSVMTGFLDLVRDSGKSLVGDVVITVPGRGIPYYERLIEELKAQPEIAAATGVIENFGLLRLPFDLNKEVQIWGVGPEFSEVTGFEDSLLWKQVTPEQREWLGRDDPWAKNPNQILEDSLNLADSRSGRPGVALGVHIWAGNKRQKDGTYRPEFDGVAAWEFWMPLFDVMLTTIPIDPQNKPILNPESKTLAVVNEFSSGVYLIDEHRVILPLHVVQELLHLDERRVTHPTEVDQDDMPILDYVDPPRVTQILIRAAEGIAPIELKERVKTVFERFVGEVNSDENEKVNVHVMDFSRSVRTWEEQQAQFIGPIENERALMSTLFQIVYLVCAGLVLAIFWGIVHEKTRDIGILRSIGASRAGIVWVFMRYGFIIGVIGSIVGFGLAWLVVTNINSIHDALADPPLWLATALFVLGGASAIASVAMYFRGLLMPIILWVLVAIALLGLGALVMYVRHIGGVVVWNPEVYLFTKIPNTVDLQTAWRTMLGAVIFSLLGATLPAARAADTDPVHALRYE